MFYYVYVEDDEGHLAGVVSLRRLLTATPETPIHEILNRDVITVNLGTDMRDVAHTITKYDLLAVPVLDEDHRMHGIVTIDDVMDIIVPPTWSSRPPKIFGKG
jgi:magnesium transporter